MSKLFVMIVVIIALTYSLYLFYKASGTLNPGKLNIVSLTAVFFYLQTFVGISLAMLGFDQHYTFKRLIERTDALTTTFWVVMAVSVLFPLVIWAVLRLVKVDPGRDYASFLRQKTDYADSKLLFWLVLAAAAVCLALLILFLKEIGYVPFLKLFAHEASFDMDVERARVKDLFVVNQYVTNVMVHLAIPVMSYFTFACAVSSKRVKWWVMAAVMFIAAVIVKTYNFAKLPIVVFALGYMLILIYHKGGIKLKWVAAFGAGGILLLVLAYRVVGVQVDLTDIYNGLWGRLFFTQVGTLSYNFDLFPKFAPFLRGRSVGRLLLPLFGFDRGDQLRSARLLMEIYGSEGVYDGTAGVMNSIFIGEAYANFGWFGIAFSVVWIGGMIALLFAVLLKMKKTPATISLAAYFTVYVATATQGGFTDFLYNISWIITFAALMLCHWLIVRAGKTGGKAAL